MTRRRPEATLRRIERRWWLLFLGARLIPAGKGLLVAGGLLAASAAVVAVAR